MQKSVAPPAPPSKRQRKAAPSKSTSTKLDDLNYDVLEFIFKKLELKDVLNMADTSKKFKPAVELALNRKIFNQYSFCFNIDRVRSDDISISKGVQRQRVNDLFTALKLLRNFGHAFRNVSIVYSMKVAPEVRDELSGYVSKYCSKYAEELNIENWQGKEMKIFDKPFTNARLVRLSNSHLVSEETLRNEWFPEMIALTLDNVTMTNSKCIFRSYFCFTSFVRTTSQARLYWLACV